MKFIVVFAAVAVLLGAVNAFQCPWTRGVNCFVNPCKTNNKCLKGQICCPNYTKGCNVDCYNCPPTSGVSCLVNPCQTSSNNCARGQTCCSNYTKGCNIKCY